MARPERFELPTLGSEDRCSIQLSYECDRLGHTAKANGPGPIAKRVTLHPWPSPLNLPESTCEKGGVGVEVLSKRARRI